MNIIFLDTETTDLENARLVQLAYKVAGAGEEVNEFFKPPVPISFGAMATHHTTNEMVADKPAFQGSPTHTRLLELIPQSIIVAHNAPFDIGVLKNEGVSVEKTIDTLRIARHVLASDQYSLQYLRYSLALPVAGTAHDAWGDVMVLEALYQHLFNITKEKFGMESDDAVVEKLLELTITPVPLTVFGFGKYRGKTFAEVNEADKGYLQWLYNSETQKPAADQNQELVLTLNLFLKPPKKEVVDLQTLPF